MLIRYRQNARPVQRFAKSFDKARSVRTRACTGEQRQPFLCHAEVATVICRKFLQSDSTWRAHGEFVPPQALPYVRSIRKRERERISVRLPCNTGITWLNLALYKRWD